MVKKKALSYRGFTEIHGDGEGWVSPDNTNYAVFMGETGKLHAFIYRNPRDRDTWCLGCEQLGISDMNMCPAFTKDSWKDAIDMAILRIGVESRRSYEDSITMDLDGNVGKDTGKRTNKFECHSSTEEGYAPVYQAKFMEYRVSVFQNTHDFGEGKDWFMRCFDIGTMDPYKIGKCDNAESACKAAISIIKNKINDMYRAACSLSWEG